MKDTLNIESGDGDKSCFRITHGTISSLRPLKNRIGTSVIFGKVSSLGQS